VLKPYNFSPQTYPLADTSFLFRSVVKNWLTGTSCSFHMKSFLASFLGTVFISAFLAIWQHWLAAVFFSSFL